jgi:hypothetical protein
MKLVSECSLGRQNLVSRHYQMPDFIKLVRIDRLVN